MRMRARASLRAWTWIKVVLLFSFYISLLTTASSLSWRSTHGSRQMFVCLFVCLQLWIEQPSWVYSFYFLFSPCIVIFQKKKLFIYLNCRRVWVDPHSVDRSVQDDDDDDGGGSITSLFPVWLHRLQVAAVHHSEHLFCFWAFCRIKHCDVLYEDDVA